MHEIQICKIFLNQAHISTNMHQTNMSSNMTQTFWKMGSPWKSQPATHPPFLCLPNCGGPPGNIRVVKLIVGDMGPLSVKSFIGLCLWIFGALLGVFEHWTLDDDDASWTCTELHPLSPLPQQEVQSPEIKMTKSIRMARTYARTQIHTNARTNAITHSPNPTCDPNAHRHAHTRTHTRTRTHHFICFQPPLLLHFYLWLESLQSEKVAFDDYMMMMTMMPI